MMLFLVQLILKVVQILIYIEYNSNASIDDGSCSTIAVYGCTNSDYVEYNENANVDDGSCLTIDLLGCTDSNACNYNSNATTDDGTCYNNDLGCGCDNPAQILDMIVMVTV